MKKVKKIIVAAFICFYTAMLAPCHAVSGEWWGFAEVGTGSDSLISFDLTLRRTFDAFYKNTVLSVSPLAELSLGYWHANSDDNIFNTTLSGGLLITFQTEGSFRPYISGTFGGAYLSGTSINNHDLGQNFQFRSKGAIGVQFGKEFRQSIQIDAAHFSNASMNNNNDGFNTFAISYGYRF